MRLITTVIITLKFLTNLASATTKMEIVRDIVNSYQSQMYDRYNVGIDLQFDENSDMLQATAGPDENNNPQIIFHGGALKKLELDEIVFVICHEIGHFLGRVHFKDTDFNPPIDPPLNYELSLEGEADYFGGKCSAKYFNDPYKAIDAARRAYSKVIESRVEIGGRYIHEIFDGVNGQYPTSECRLQTATNGALGHKRPACWYNPRKN